MYCLPNILFGWTRMQIRWLGAERYLWSTIRVRIEVCAYQLEDSSALTKALTKVSDLLLSIHPLPDVWHSTVTLYVAHSTWEGLGFKEP